MIKALSLFLVTAPVAQAPAPAPHPPPPATGAPTVTPFRTEVPPRVDPVFGDISEVRKAVDDFLSLQTEMAHVRDEFSTAVHATLGVLALPRTGPAAKSCPSGASARYGRALESGRKFLSLGRRLEGRFREIRRSETLGDSIGLTPDYRWKIKKATELYGELLRDYREMRVAFYDQLGAEMRHAGCDVPTAPVAGPADPEGPPNAAPHDPGNPAAWELEQVTEQAAREQAELAPATTGANGRPATTPAKKAEPMAGAIGPAIWIEIDNSQCGQPSRLFIDGSPNGAIAARRKVSVRTRSGPHELCVLPETDKRTCGDQGTVRKAYLYEGWTLAVRCEKK